MNVVVLGASPRPDRYANMAVRALVAAGHRVIPVTPCHATVEGLATRPDLDAVAEAVDAVTVYVSPEHSSAMVDAMVALDAPRWIFNPGAENPAVETALRDAGREVLRACTLVMLRLGRF